MIPLFHKENVVINQSRIISNQYLWLGYCVMSLDNRNWNGSNWEYAVFSCSSTTMKDCDPDNGCTANTQAVSAHFYTNISGYWGSF